MFENEVYDELLMASNWKPTKSCSNLFTSGGFSSGIIFPECFTIGRNKLNTSFSLNISLEILVVFFFFFN